MYLSKCEEHGAWSVKAVNRKLQIVNRKSNPLLLCRRTGIGQSSFGFTSLELIVVIVAIAILAGTAIVRFQVTDQDKSTIAADQLIADIQYVQMRAMGIGSTQSIQFANVSNGYGPNEYSISGEPGTKRLPDKDGRIVVTSTNFSILPYNNVLYFNSLGEPCLSYSIGPPATCTIGDNCQISLGTGTTGIKTVTVRDITGKVE
jgi:type II secretory pathway pseudopilin PulG